MDIIKPPKGKHKRRRKYPGVRTGRHNSGRNKNPEKKLARIMAMQQTD